ncbi:MAG: methionine--tRNA ligase [Bacilli bacterium]|nr:methionine--tRNA ligase [Bacilli bacterium]MDD4056106.1 methionine--tRNA ligase [Bacilli bacterium]
METKNKKTCYVTTPIYYSSGNVHIGNSYTTIACDVFARYHRLKEYDTYYLTGMDEHGLKIEEAAKKVGKNPQDFVNEIAENTKALWKKLNISNDDFIQTSELRHTEVVQQIFERLLQSGDIYLGYYEGDYCVSCEAFFTKTQVGEECICPDCGKPTRKIKEESYFLNLKKYSDRLLKYIADHPNFIQPESRRNEVVSFIEQGLEDLCVSRTSFKWGIPVLSNPKHVVYVWIDALCNYITALGYGSKDETLFDKYWLNGDVVAHVVGKDILRFHAIFWPIILMALDIPLNFKLYVHGWVLMKEGKMSKSVGNIVYPQDVTSRYGLDSLRYYLVREMPLGNDCLFSYDRFVERYNTDLANDLGNLVSRTIAMINKYFAGRVQKPTQIRNSISIELSKIAAETIEKFNDSFTNFRFQSGLIEVWNLVSRANKYIDETSPWILAKDEAKKEELNEVMYHLYESLRLVAIMISSVVPETAETILSNLQVSDDNRGYQKLTFGVTDTGKVKERIDVLFKRLDVIEEQKYHQNEAEKAIIEPTKEEVSLSDFEKIDIRVGEVLEAKKMEGSDKLLIFQIKVEDKVRQIISGIAQFYNPQELIGKKLLVVANLKPVKIRGQLSEGMILTASSSDDSLEVLQVTKENSFAKIS